MTQVHLLLASKGLRNCGLLEEEQRIVMNGIHKIPRPEWAARYAAVMWRQGATGSIKELVAAGCTLWLSAGHQLPESVALVRCESLAISQRSPASKSEASARACPTHPPSRSVEGRDA